MSVQNAVGEEAAGQLPDLFQVMANELARARANKTFPPTNAPQTDVQATAHDYELLLQLQQAALCSDRNSDTTSYDHMLVEITRRIRDRDEAYNQEATRDEAVRRVESYLRSIEHEREHFESVRSSSSSVVSPSTPASAMSPCCSGSSAVEVNEDVLSIYEQAAEQALGDVARPLIQGLENYAELHEEQKQLVSKQEEAINEHMGLSNEQKALHHQQVALVKSQQFMVEQHDENNLRSSQLLEEQKQALQEQKKATRMVQDVLNRLDEHDNRQGFIVEDLLVMNDQQAQSLVALQNAVSAATSASNQLSQIVVNLPQAIYHIVNTVVEEQTKIAVANIADAYQTAIDELQERKMNHFHEMFGDEMVESGYCDGGSGDPTHLEKCSTSLGRSRKSVRSVMSTKKLKKVAKKILMIGERR
ncbi:hypothetical protein CC79DRAFT_1399462 [Sarocladium strictum]